MAKRKRRKASLHSAGKVQEAELLARARELRDDPSLATPICEGPCVLFSPVVAARKGIAKVHAARDDEAKLTSLASRGNDLARAYAATLLLARADKVPYVAELRLPGGMTASYVARGKTKAFYLAGLQNHDDRQLRLLAVTPWVKKRGLHFYSADRGIVCTGRRNAPPRDFVEEEADALGLAPAGPDRFTCGHEGRDTLVLGWRGANVTLERCSACFGDVPTLVQVAQHMAVPGVLRGFDVSIRLAPLQGIAVDVSAPLDEATLRAYVAGGRSDAQLVEAARAGRIAQLRARKERLYVAGDTSFGADVDAFVAALQTTPAEARAIRAALAERAGPVVLDKPTSARALAELWSDHARAMLEAAAGDAAVAERLARDKATPEQAQDLVRRAEREGSHKAVAAALPVYRSLPPQAAVADAIARAYRTAGAEAAVRAAMERASGGKGKGVALAFLQALQAAKGQEWRFTQADHDVAAGVGPAVAALLRGDPARYHEALREASLRAGETVAFEPAG